MGYKRFVYVSDNHGQEIDPKSEIAFFKFLKIWKPEIRIHGGDGFDFAALRSKASEEERRISLVNDYNCGVQFIEKLQPTHYLEGNHCKRIRLLAETDNGVKSDFAKGTCRDLEKVFKKFRTQFYRYSVREGILQIGKLAFIHGFAAGETAALVHARAFDNVIGGHVHSPQVASIPNKSRRMGWSSGCMCRLDLPYLDASIRSLSHNNGWVYGLLYDNGEFEVYPVNSVNGKFRVSTQFTEI